MFESSTKCFLTKQELVVDVGLFEQFAILFMFTLPFIGLLYSHSTVMEPFVKSKIESRVVSSLVRWAAVPKMRPFMVNDLST